MWHLAVARGKVFTIDNDSGEGTTNQFSRHCTHETADEGRFWRRLARESFHETADVRREAEGFAFCLLGRERQTPRRESRDAELDLDAGASAWSWRAGGEREGRRERKVFTSFDCRPEGKFSCTCMSYDTAGEGGKLWRRPARESFGEPGGGKYKQ